MSDNHAHEVTRILHEWRNGDHSAAERLFPLVYGDLRQRARKHLGQERPDHTLQPTALVHEAYMKLAAGDSVTALDRAHFYAIASRVMRQILVDHARKNKALKRGGGAETISLDEPPSFAPSSSAADLISLDDALGLLEKADPRKSKVVDLRFFGGLSNAEIAQALGVTEKTVQRDWHFARLFLYRELANA